MSFLSELKRRHVVRVALVYAAVAFAVLQAADLLVPRLLLPDWTITLVLLLALLGFPVALVLAWAFELTPDGVKRTEAVVAAPPHSGRRGWIGVRTVVTAVALVAAGLLAGWFLRPPRDAAAGAEPAIDAMPSLAVLPLENVGGDAANASFAVGLHDDLLTQLSKVGGLRLVSRTSVREYAGTTRNVRDIGVELGVANILEGSVQRAGEQVRINVQLIEAGTDRHLWAETYDEVLTVANLFAIQAEIAAAIARALHAELTGETRAAIAHAPTEDLAAYEAYLRGLAAGWWNYGSGAADAFAEAARIDPTFAPAHAAVARARTWLARMAFLEGEPARAREHATAARAALARAESLAPGAPETKLAQGYLAYYLEWDLERALARFRELQATTPNDTDVAGAAGLVLRRLGRWDEALAEFQRAMLLDRRSEVGAYELGQTYYFLGRFDEALRFTRLAMELNPASEDPPGIVLAALVGRGDTLALREFIERSAPRMSSEFPDPYLLLRLDRSAMARRLEEVLGNPDGRGRPLVHGAAVRWAHRLGDTMRQRLYADSLIAAGEAGLRALGATANPRVRSDQHRIAALGYAYRGDGPAAARHAHRAVELIPFSLDATEGWAARVTLLEVLTLAGRHDDAVTAAAEFLRPPSPLSVAWLGFDPMFDPLRGHPGFRDLLAEKAARRP